MCEYVEHAKIRACDKYKSLLTMLIVDISESLKNGNFLAGN